METAVNRKELEQVEDEAAWMVAAPAAGTEKDAGKTEGETAGRDRSPVKKHSKNQS